MKTIDAWLKEAGGRPYVDEEMWEECARHLERKLIAMRTALSEAENELRVFGSFDGHIARWERDIATTKPTPTPSPVRECSTCGTNCKWPDVYGKNTCRNWTPKGATT